MPRSRARAAPRAPRRAVRGSVIAAADPGAFWVTELPADLHAGVVERAAGERRSVASLVADAVAGYLAERGRRPRSWVRQPTEFAIVSRTFVD